MPSIGLQKQIRVGDEVVFSSDSPAARYGVVFEDDGTVGYLYGIEFTDEKHEIVDSMHIYNVSSVMNKDGPCTIRIVWSDDGLKAALLIDDYPHAVFDFADQRGFCRTNFPAPSPNWKGHEWADQALDGLF